MKGYWILFTHYECPVCGSGSDLRERITNRPKPENAAERHEYFPYYDGCMDRELY